MIGTAAHGQRLKRRESSCTRRRLSSIIRFDSMSGLRLSPNFLMT
jgi:hypothetical protein